MPRRSVKILTGRGWFYATSQFAKSLLEDGLARTKSSHPFVVQLTAAERVDTAYAPPGLFADELRGFIDRLYKLNRRNGRKVIPSGLCRLCRNRWALKNQTVCSTCKNDSILLDKISAGEVGSIDELVTM